MLLCVTDDAAAPTRRTPAPRRRFWLFSAWLPSTNGSLFGVGASTRADRRVRAVHEVRRDGAAGDLHRRAGRDAHAVLAEVRAGVDRKRRRNAGRAAARRLAVADDQAPEDRVDLAAGGEVVVGLARVAARDLVVGQDRHVVDPRRRQRRRLARRVVARRAVDEDADRVVLLDARVVDRERARRLRLGLRLRLPSGTSRVTIATPMPKLLLRKPPGTV